MYFVLCLVDLLLPEEMLVLKIIHFLFFLVALILTIVNIYHRYFTFQVIYLYPEDQTRSIYVCGIDFGKLELTTGEVTV